MFNNNPLKLIAESKVQVAENPLWDEQNQCLYWKGDRNYIFRKHVNSSPADFKTYQLEVGVGGMALTKNNELLLFGEAGRVWLWQPEEAAVQVAQLPYADEKTYFNDLIVDPEGRVFCGVLANNFHDPINRGKHGSLWRLDPSGDFSCLEAETGACPNGMGFSPDFRYFYFAVTDEKNVYRYEYDRSTGKISNPTALISRPGCDGMTVDSEGYLWVAHWGGPLVRYSAEGEIMTEYNAPSNIRAISSVTFGGPDLQDIYVTTANYPPGNAFLNYSNGGVLHMPQEIKGLPEFRAEFPGRKTF